MGAEALVAPGFPHATVTLDGATETLDGALDGIVSSVLDAQDLGEPAHDPGCSQPTCAIQHFILDCGGVLQRVHLVHLPKGAPAQEAKVGEALAEEGLWLAGVVQRGLVGGLEEGAGQGGPGGGGPLGEHSAHGGAALGGRPGGQ